MRFGEQFNTVPCDLVDRWSTDKLQGLNELLGDRGTVFIVPHEVLMPQNDYTGKYF